MWFVKYDALNVQKYSKITPPQPHDIIKFSLTCLDILKKGFVKKFTIFFRKKSSMDLSSSRILIWISIQKADLVYKNFSDKFDPIHTLPITIIVEEVFVRILWAQNIKIGKLRIQQKMQ